MGKNIVREPTQQRSIEKKEKIIKAGFKLICQKGYHNTNTAEIAKEAGVSTGIVYQYFEDKRDILLYGLDLYARNLMFPINSIANKKLDKKNLEKEFKKIIDESVKKHTISRKAHEEIVALQHSDKDIEKIFEVYELDASNSLVSALRLSGFSDDKINEKAHIIISIIDSLCHEVAYHKHKNMNYDAMTDLVIKSIIFILNS